MPASPPPSWSAAASRATPRSCSAARDRRPPGGSDRRRRRRNRRDGNRTPTPAPATPRRARGAPRSDGGEPSLHHSSWEPRRGTPTETGTRPRRGSWARRRREVGSAAASRRSGAAASRGRRRGRSARSGRAGSPDDADPRADDHHHAASFHHGPLLDHRRVAQRLDAPCRASPARSRGGRFSRPRKTMTSLHLLPSPRNGECASP